MMMKSVFWWRKPEHPEETTERELRNFLFQYRTTPHTVTGVSPAEMLMGRKLRNKLPKIQMDAEPMDELQWQRQVRERDARRKRYEEYGDKTRGARASDLEVGDQVLLKQNRRDKLTTPFEAGPYEVVDRNGNAVVIQRGEGPRKMRNVAHMKRLSGSKKAYEGQGVNPMTITRSDSSTDSETIMEDELLRAAEPPPPPVPVGPRPVSVPETPSVRPMRARSEPAWMCSGQA